MSATTQRDKAMKLAKQNPQKAMELAQRISDPWFQSQAFYWIARFTEDDPVVIAKQAAKASEKCADEYKRTAVRAWEITALLERGKTSEARSALKDTLNGIAMVTPKSSQAEALTLLLHAATRIDDKAIKAVANVLQAQCSTDSHWRCKRALKDCARILNKEIPPRPFFW